MRQSNLRMLPSILCLLLAASAAPAAEASWRGEATQLSGTAQYSHGEWVYTDILYDDSGPQDWNEDDQETDHSAPGAYYHGHGDNAADIVELRVRPRGRDLDMRVKLNSLKTRHSTALGIAVGKGRNARPWPGGADVASPWRRFVTVADGAVRVTSASGATRRVGTARENLRANTITFRIPRTGRKRRALPLNVGAGTWDSKARAYREGILDLAFNTTEIEGFGKDEEASEAVGYVVPDGPREHTQHKAIEAGDVTRFRQVVSLKGLRAGRDRPYVAGPGLYNRHYRTGQDLEEGYGGYREEFPRFRGRFQEYTVFIPTAYRPERRSPLLMLLHSLDGTHNEYTSFPHIYENLGERNDAVVVTPLGLGTDGWYHGEALLDTLRVWAHARRHYNLDDDRTNVAGYSMGGLGAWRLATFLPDRFGAVSVRAGVTAQEFDLLENLRNVPAFSFVGSNDPLVALETQQTSRLRALGYDHRFQVLPNYEHYARYEATRDWSVREGEFLADRARVSAPGNVVFKVIPERWTAPPTPWTDRELDEKERTALLASIRRLGFDLFSAYWVHDIGVRGGETGTAAVDVVSEAIARRTPVTSDVAGQELEGTDSPYVETGVAVTLADAPVRNALSGSLAGVCEVTIDLEAAGLSLDGLELDITVDGPTTVHLRAGAVTDTRQLGGEPAGACFGPS